MEPITALFGIACIGAGGGVGFWLKQNHEKMQKLTDNNILLQESQSAHFSQLNSQVNTMNQKLSSLTGMVDALRATNPELDGALQAHTTITHLEQLRELGESIDDVSAFATAISTLETLVSPISVECEVGSTNILSQATNNLVTRLIDLFDNLGIDPAKAGLNAVSAHKLGHVPLL